MEKIVRKAQKSAVLLGDQGVYQLGYIEEARPSRLGNLPRECRRAGAPVKRVVTFPERLPLAEICRGRSIE